MPVPTNVDDGGFAVSAQATSAAAASASWVPTTSGHVFYVSGVVITWTAETLVNGSATAPASVGVSFTNRGGLIDTKVGGTTTLSGLTGLGTGKQTTPGGIAPIPFDNLPSTADDILNITADQTAGSGVINVTVYGHVGAAPVSNAPSLLVAGVSGAQALAVSVDTSVTPLIVQGKVGGVAQPVSVAAAITVDTSTPLGVKTTGTNTVKVIPG